MSRSDDVRRIPEGLQAAAEGVASVPSGIEFGIEETRPDPVTTADAVLKETLAPIAEGRLYEESDDDAIRLECDRMWFVDSVAGARESIQDILELSVSELLDGGVPVAGAAFNLATDKFVLGSLEAGVTMNGEPVPLTEFGVG